MRFLVDEDLPRSLAGELRAAGVDAADVRDVGLRGRTDEEVLAYAAGDGRAVLTADVGFGNILRFPLGQHAGIVLARFPSEIPVRDLNRILVEAIAGLRREDITGNVITVTERRVRIRRSPQA